MWFKRKPKQVKCEVCKHYIDEADAQCIKWWDKKFYCPMHRKPYDKIESRPISCKQSKCKNPNKVVHWHEKEVYLKRIPESYKEIKIKE